MPVGGWRSDKDFKPSIIEDINNNNDTEPESEQKTNLNELLDSDDEANNFEGFTQTKCYIK